MPYSSYSCMAACALARPFQPGWLSLCQVWQNNVLRLTPISNHLTCQFVWLKWISISYPERLLHSEAGHGRTDHRLLSSGPFVTSDSAVGPWLYTTMYCQCWCLSQTLQNITTSWMPDTWKFNIRTIFFFYAIYITQLAQWAQWAYIHVPYDL